MTTKTEEIREGIATVIRVNKDKFAKCLETEIADELTEELIYWMTDKIEHNLHSQGCVLKVDRELPEVSDEHSYYELCAQADMLKAGYSAFVPLID